MAQMVLPNSQKWKKKMNRLPALVSVFVVVYSGKALSNPPSYPRCSSSSYPTMGRVASMQYMAGDWDGDGVDTLAVRNTCYGNANRMPWPEYTYIDPANAAHCVHFDINGDFQYDSYNDGTECYGNGYPDEYISGDWNGDGTTNLAVVRGNVIYVEWDFNSATTERVMAYGNGVPGDEYFGGHWTTQETGDHIAVRLAGTNTIYFDTDWDGLAEFQMSYGNGDSDQYLVGDWDGDGRDNIAVRRGTCFYFDTDFDGSDTEDWCCMRYPWDSETWKHWVVGDWFPDGEHVDYVGNIRSDGTIEVMLGLYVGHQCTFGFAFGGQFVPWL